MINTHAQGVPVGAHDIGLRRVSCPIHHNLGPDQLVDLAKETDECSVASSGALIAYSGAKTGRSPKDKRVVVHPESQDNVWWGEHSPNKSLSADSYEQNRKIATSFLEQCSTVFVQDGFANWGTEARIKVRVVCTRAYHALFMHNMMIRPNTEELKNYGQPDFIIYNAGKCPADPSVPGVDSTTSIAINLERY